MKNRLTKIDKSPNKNSSITRSPGTWSTFSSSSWESIGSVDYLDNLNFQPFQPMEPLLLENGEKTCSGIKNPVVLNNYQKTLQTNIRINNVCEEKREIRTFINFLEKNNK